MKDTGGSWQRTTYREIVQSVGLASDESELIRVTVNLENSRQIKLTGAHLDMGL